MMPEIKGLNILIIGCPASGKTFFANKLKEESSDDVRVFHTDDYMYHGYKDSLYVLLEDLKKIKPPTNSIIEGVQGYRLLRKGVELDCYYPDIVVELSVSEERMLKTYREERQGKSIDSLYAFNKAHNKVLNDYFAMPNHRKPKWIKIENKY